MNTAEKMSMYPAKRVSLFAIAAPMSPRLENSAAWTPERVVSVVVAVRITKSAVAKPRKPPMSPTMNCFFIQVTRISGWINVPTPVQDLRDAGTRP
jgi:hypothetical protein